MRLPFFSFSPEWFHNFAGIFFLVLFLIFFYLMYICETSVWPFKKQTKKKQSNLPVLFSCFTEALRWVSPGTVHRDSLCVEMPTVRWTCFLLLLFFYYFVIKRGGEEGARNKKTWDRKGRVSIGRPGKAYPKKSVGIKTEKLFFLSPPPPCGIVFF